MSVYIDTAKLMYTKDLLDIGKALSQYRRKMGLTQAEVGRRTSIDRQTISAIENGRFTGSLGILMRYLHFANLSLSATEAKSPYPTLDELADRYGDDDD